MSFEFQTTTYGKWILAGEHAVVRGHPALVFPLHNRQLVLCYSATSKTLRVTQEGLSGNDLTPLFLRVLEQGMQIIGKSKIHFTGHFHLYCNIPIGVGMGASAALCVALARWFSHYRLLPEATLIQDFAKELEHLFHGKSSGLDIAGVAAHSGIYFANGTAQPIKATWQPNWYLSSCGQIGITAHCINNVQTLWDKNPKLAAQLDVQMYDAVHLSLQALTDGQPQAVKRLAHAINLAGACFNSWGLISDTLKKHIHSLKQQGAIAVKPTGSGGGGHVISLWPVKSHNPPSACIAINRCTF